MKSKTAEDKKAVEPPKGYPKGKPRPAHYYKLSEKDHPTIIDGLRHYASLYHIALRIGCGYSTIKAYLAKHPELVAVQREAQESVAEFVESQIVRRCASGYFPALAFYAERKMGWTQHQTIENVGALPIISFGIVPEDKLPPPSTDEEVKELEARYLRGDAEAAKADAEGGKESGNRDDLYDDANPEADDEDAEFWGVDANDDEPFGSGMFET